MGRARPHPTTGRREIGRSREHQEQWAGSSGGPAPRHLGHRTIAHLAGPMDGFEARERVEGWRESLAEAGLPEGPLVVGDWTSDLGYAFGRSFDLGETTAVFAANDQTALGVLHGVHGRGIRVPDDISLVGFDDLSDARHFLPPLTTVRQDFSAVGASALRQIIAAIEGDATPRHDMIPPELIVRGSTKAPQSRR
ncbi:substrate-binding domain-containing protein [Microbacterium sp. CFBP 13617]|uniref:substrate-binding domain-containing protein n=1 Tax=Microbacterium sp. CFBP 13617 TaxID=2774035 RepID=UPI0031408076